MMLAMLLIGLRKEAISSNVHIGSAGSQKRRFIPFSFA
jgi:hypothetical protein